MLKYILINFNIEMILNDEVQAILSESKRLEILDTGLKSSLFDLSTRTKKLAERIKNGESTGDKIRDFAIVHFGYVSADAEKPLRELEIKVKENISSNVLVVSEREVNYGCVGIAPPKINDSLMKINYTNLKLGVLTSPLELVLREGMIILPTEKYVIFSGQDFIDKFSLENGSIFLHWFDLVNHEIKDIYFGNEVEEYFSRNENLKCLYVEALNSLEKELPKDFKEHYEKSIYREKVEIVSALEGLIEKEAVRDKKVFDNSVIVYRNSVIKEDIQRYLSKAVKLGMHTGNLKILLRPGVEVNVPAYLSAMCKKYEVSIE